MKDDTVAAPLSCLTPSMLHWPRSVTLSSVLGHTEHRSLWLLPWYVSVSVVNEQ